MNITFLSSGLLDFSCLISVNYETLFFFAIILGAREKMDAFVNDFLLEYRCIIDNLIRRMGFMDLFLTTNRGIPDTSNLPASTTMTRQYYVASMLLQCTIMLLFLFYFILSIYRVYKKIKNSKFKDIKEEPKQEEQEPEKTEVDVMNQHELQKKDEDLPHNNLIYRFDEDEDEVEDKKSQHKEEDIKSGDEKEKEEEQGKSDKEGKEQTKSQSSNYDDYHDENEEKFIALDEKLLFLQPFLIPFIVSNNLFAADFIGLACLILMLVSYFLFNVKGILGHIKIIPLLFMGFSLLGFLPYYIHDHDITT